MNFSPRQINNQNHVLFDRIVRLLQWAEMSHIWSIMRYIFNDNQEVLAFPELHVSKVSSTSTNIAFLKRYPKEDRPYLKLIGDHNNLIPLQSGNFIYFATVVQGIAALTQPSMKNFITRYSESVKAFQAQVVR